MAKQDPNPPPWDDSMSDGCTGVPDWLPFVGSMLKECKEHDRAFHYGGGEKEFRAANEKFEKGIRRPWCLICWAVAWWRRGAVRLFGRKNFNWLGPGMPVDGKEIKW